MWGVSPERSLVAQNPLIQTSKFLSLILRHQPEKIGLTLDPQGWVAVDQLLAACTAHRHPLTREVLQKVVAENNKQRFAFSDDGLRIRASQGHSQPVDLGYQAQVPPDVLYHGTATPNLPSIQVSGLEKRKRHHVHLSVDRETAIAVGKRYGQPVVLEVLAGQMAAAGLPFYVSANGVWLTDHVPPEYLHVLREHQN